MAAIRTLGAESVEQTVETIEWSAPDSSGRQYALRSVRTVTTVCRHQERGIAVAETTAHKVDARTAVSTASDEQNETKTDVKPIKHNRMRIALIIIVILALIALEAWALVRHERQNRGY